MKYQLVIKKEFTCLDDIDARNKAKQELDKFNNLLNDTFKIKLQELEENKPPRGISIELKGNS